MVLFNFSGDVVDLIRSGIKTTTIRRRHPSREAQLEATKTYHLWQDVRSPDRVHIGNYELASMTPLTFPEFRRMHPDTQLNIAQADGFDTVHEMERWFRNHYGRELDSIQFTVHRWKQEEG